MKDYPVIKFTLLFICGILVQPLIKLSLVFFLITILLIASLAIFYFISLKQKNLILSILFFLLILLLGSFRASIAGGDSFISENLYKIKNFSAFGTISEVELKRDNEIEFYLLADSVKAGNIIIARNIKLIGRIRELKNKEMDSIYDSISPGNLVMISGTYTKGREMRNPGEFDYNKYLRSKGISGIVTAYYIKDFKLLNKNSNFFLNGIFQIRKSIYKTILKYHSKQTASLLKSLLLADRSDIDYETKTGFINSGVMHVLAVSGLHTGFIILFLLLIFGRLNVYFRSIVVIIGLVLFLLITGMPVSVFRASVMAVTLLTAYILNRSSNLFNSLALAALIILLINPWDIYTAGFQLSFSAVLSIGVIFPFFKRKIEELNIKNNLLKYFILLLVVSLCVEIGTLPVMVSYFRKLSLISAGANLVVIPLIGLIILIAIVTLLLDIISPLIAGIYAAANELFTYALFKLIKTAGSLDYSFIWVRNFSNYDTLIFYSFLILFLYYYKRFQSTAAKFILFFLVVINFFLFSELDNKELLQPGKLNIIMVDVGQGDSFLLCFPDGKTALIDGGPAYSYFDAGERTLIPLLDYLGINKIDYGFISHLDADHYGGFVSLIHNNRIKEIYKPALDSTDINDMKLEKYLSQNKIPISYYHKEILKLNNLRIYFLHNSLTRYESKNNRCGVIKIVYGKNSFLFPGDAELKREKLLVKKYNSFLDSDLLKVSHHGSSSGTSGQFLNVVKPRISLISAGIGNKYGHPSAKTLDRLREAKSEIYRTDKLGAVFLSSNGEAINLINWKNY